MQRTIPYGKAVSLLQNDVMQALALLELTVRAMEAQPTKLGEREDFDTWRADAVLLMSLYEEFTVPYAGMQSYWKRIRAATLVTPRMEEV